MNISEELIKYRAVHGLTQEKMAELCGVDRQTILKAEKGSRILKTTEFKIRKVIGV